MYKMKFMLLLSVAPTLCHAQMLSEKKNLRFYEHHSSVINNGAPFGNGANGTKSGYDLLKHEFVSSFKVGGGNYSAAELERLDMVEHNGPFGNNGPLGFTSATSSIWAGAIKGNGTTTFALVPGFNYDTVKYVSTIKKVFATQTPTKVVSAATAGGVYLGRVRNTETYVVIKITAAKPIDPNARPGDTASVHFDFSYKYGTLTPAGTDVATTGTGLEQRFSIVPNPTKGHFAITGLPASLEAKNATISITDVMGRVVHTQPASVSNVAQQLSPGIYIIAITDAENKLTQSLVVTE